MAGCALAIVFGILTFYLVFEGVLTKSIKNHGLISLSSSCAPSLMNNCNSNKELQLVHVVFRHGIRTPTDTYPTDPYINQTFFPEGWGQITNYGKKKLFDLGKWLRKRFNTFLGTFYQPDMVHAQATGVSRTLVTLSAVLAGLWPPNNTPMEWNQNLNWQPIPIYSEPLENDTLLLVRVSCPRYHEALLEVFELPEIKKILNENQAMFKELTKYTEMNIKTPDDVQSIYSTLLAEESFGLQLPLWTTRFYPKMMKNIVELSYIFNVYTDELKRIKGGPFLKKMINEWKQKRDNTLVPNKRKIFLYTGHDSTVVNILSALNIWQQQIPVYGIMAIFELYKDITTGEYEVQIYLKNETNREPYPLTIPGCTFECPLDEVIKLTENIIPPSNDLKDICKAKDPNFIEPELGGP